MSVTDQPVDLIVQASPDTRPELDPQAAIELAHELVLLTRATFAQQRPETAVRAISGVPGLGTSTRTVAPTTPTTDAIPTQPLTAAPGVVAPQAPSAPDLEQTQPISVSAVGGASISISTVSVPVAAAPGAPHASEPISMPAAEHRIGGDAHDVPGIALPVPVPTDAESAAGYVPVPGVEQPAAAPVVPSAPATVSIPVTPVPLVDDHATAAPEIETETETETENTEPVEVAVTVVPAAPLRPLHPNLAMLEEIGFLDE